MSHESTDLKLYIDNDYSLYSGQRKSIVDNLLKKKNAGTYSSAKAVKLWEYLAESGAKKYAKEFGGTWHKIFSTSDRRQVANELSGDFEIQYRAGEHHQRQMDVETKAQQAKREKRERQPQRPPLRVIYDEHGNVLGRSALPGEPSRSKPRAKKRRTKKRRTKRASTCGTSGGKCTKAEIEKMFKSTVMPTILDAEAYDGVPDRPMRREAWNNWIDGLQRDGTITERQADTWGHPKWLETWKGKRRR